MLNISQKREPFSTIPIIVWKVRFSSYLFFSHHSYKALTFHSEQVSKKRFTIFQKAVWQPFTNKQFSPKAIKWGWSWWPRVAVRAQSSWGRTISIQEESIAQDLSALPAGYAHRWSLAWGTEAEWSKKGSDMGSRWHRVLETKPTRTQSSEVDIRKQWGKAI